MIRAEGDIGGTEGDKVREVRLEWDHLGTCEDFVFYSEWDEATGVLSREMTWYYVIIMLRIGYSWADYYVENRLEGDKV